MIRKINRAIEAAEDWLDYTDAGAFVAGLLLGTLLISGWLTLWMVAA